MCFIFVGGVQPKTKILDEKPRSCPSCGLHRAFLKRTDHYLSLFFIPLFPIRKGEEYVECQRCGSRSGESGEPWSRPGLSCARCGAVLEKQFRYCPACGNPVK